MEFEGEFGVSTTPTETWEFLLDPDRLGACIPNAHDIEVIDEDNFTAEVGVKVSHISVTFGTNVEIVDRDPESYLKVHITGEAKDSDGRMEATGELRLEPMDGGTRIWWKNSMDITGRMMSLGSRIVKRVGKRQTDKTIDNIQAELGAVSLPEA
jgi:carbon monoxide dehydrogenase subunit G